MSAGADLARTLWAEMTQRERTRYAGESAEWQEGYVQGRWRDQHSAVALCNAATEMPPQSG